MREVYRIVAETTIMNHAGLLKISVLIERNPDLLDLTNNGDEAVIKSVRQGLPIKPLALAGWAVAVLGTAEEFERKRNNSSATIRYKLYGSQKILAVITTSYAIQLLGFDGIEDIILYMALWPETWWDLTAVMNYSDIEKREIRLTQPTPKQVVRTLRKMAWHDAHQKPNNKYLSELNRFALQIRKEVDINAVTIFAAPQN